MSDSVNRNKPAGENKPLASVKRPLLGGKKPAAGDKTPETGEKKPIMSEKTRENLKKAGKITLRVLSYVANVLMTLLLVGTLCAVIIGTVFCIYIKNYIDPNIDSSLFVTASSDKTTRIYYNEYETEDDRINQNGTPVEIEDQRLYSTDNSIWVSYDNIPDALKEAFICVEDKRFKEHNGVDWLRTGKAVVMYFFGDGSFGGSTITQQLVKNLTGDNQNTIQRKVQEIFRALKLEKDMSKEEILEMYMNIVFLGNNCYGVQAASNFYFDKDVADLSLTECAALAGIVKNPSQYEPLRHDIFYKEDADGKKEEVGNRARRRTVLYTMWQQGKISESEFDEAWDTDLVLAGKKEDDGTSDGKTSAINSWYTDAVILDVKNALMEKYSYSDYVASLMIYTGGLQIYTCMDPEVQSVIDEVYVNDETYFPYVSDGLQPESSMIIIDPYTGDVLGLAGGRGEKTQNRILNRATQAKRPCGSSIKPLSVYGPGIDTGTITMGTVYDDCPVITKNDGTIWPHNLPDIYNGYTTVQDAIRRSVNTCAVKIINDVTLDYSFDFLSNTLNMKNIIESYTTAGGQVVTDKSPAPLALGQFSYGITLWELTAGYTIFPNDGVYSKSRLWTEVRDSEGNLILENTPDYEIAISEEAASIMTMMMQNVVSSGTATAVTVDQYVDVAGKTGTTSSDFDRTFIGYTPYYVCGCWFGYDMNQALSDFARNPAITVWDTVMTKLQEKIGARASANGEEIKKFTYSDNIVKATYCKDSGMLLGEACSYDPRGSRAETGWFTSDTVPTQTCDVHVLVDYDKVTGGVASDGCPEGNLKKVALVRNENRSFAKQIVITDAQYVYRDHDPSLGFPTYEGFPYFYFSIPEGTYVGRSSSVYQFNSFCTTHYHK